jgi:hypothetical protein
MASKSKSFEIVKKLLDIFTNENNNYPKQLDKLKKIIKNIEDTSKLFGKLLNLIKECENQCESIHKQNDFENQLEKFKNLIEDSINNSTQSDDILRIINDFISAIGEDYKKIRDYIQTLDEINFKIDNKLIKKKLTFRSDVAQLLKRGVDKIPNRITKNNITDKLKVLTFCSNFIKYAALLRELKTDFDGTRYRQSLEKIQTKILNNVQIDIHNEYFTRLQEKIVKDRGYSTEILFEHLATNEVMIRSITNNSSSYWPLMLKIAESFLESSTEQKLIETLTSLVYHLNKNSFENLIKEIFKNDKLIELIFKAIYNKGIQLFCQAEPNFEPTKKEKLKELEKKFTILFTNEFEIKRNQHSLLDVLRDQIIDETNAIGTKHLLERIYGIRIESLDFSDNVTHVKYCFNSCFFKTLSYSNLEDIQDLSLLSQIVFYAFACDTKQEPLSELKVDPHENDLSKLKNYFKQKKYEIQLIFDSIEVLKMMINLESFQFRLKCIKTVLDNSEENNSNTNTKVTLLKLFLEKTTNSKEIYLRLAESFNIHLLKEAIKDESILIDNLSKSNPNFKLYISKLKNLKKKFNVKQDLIAGFSIPYYLSAKLAEEDPLISDETIMCTLFKVFTCSLDHDKKEFFKNKTKLNKEFKKLSESVSRLIKFYQDNSRTHRTIADKLKDKCLNYILEGFSGSIQKTKTESESLSERNEYARLIIDNFINYKFEHIIEVIKANKTSGETEILTVFDYVLKRKEYDNLSDWTEQTSKLGDKTFFLYCYYKYSETEFDKWFKELNPNVSNYDSIQSKKEFLENEDAFNLINIKYLQHNQVGALSLIYDYLEDESKSQTSNLFIKVGTGQGKSLIIAETAKKIITKNRELGRTKQQIFIITCYDHLAKRDYENYQKYFKYFDINSVYCSSSTSTKDFSDKDVIYADLETLFNVLRKEGYNSIIKSTSIQIPNYENSVLILDEFDSLILDSDEIYQSVKRFKLKSAVALKDLTDEKKVCSLLDKEKLIVHFKDKFPLVFQDWWSSVQQQGIDHETKTNQDSLGKDTTFCRSFLTELSAESCVSLVYFYLDALVFYSKFKQAIGFSGSVNLSGMNKFENLFKKKSTIYFEIPPFFGLQGMKMNRVNLKTKVTENRDDFLKEIETDIRIVCKEQPILIFADSLKNKNELKSDFDLIKEELETKFKEFTIIYIQTEADINSNIHKIGKLGSITLATRIIGRGADIKVDKNIPKGLHLLLTYYPKRENIYIQMLGRTARQDEKGSFSEVVRFEKNFTDVNEVKINATAELAHNLNEYFYKKVSSSKKKIDIKWALFSEFVRSSSSDYNEKELQNFIDEFIL